MAGGTLESRIVTSIAGRVAPGAGQATVDATRGMIESAPRVNALGRAAKALSAANYLRSAVCATALRTVGDRTRGDLAAVHGIFDADSAAVAALSLTEYRASIDDLPPVSDPGITLLRERAKEVLAETIAVIRLLTDESLSGGMSEQDEIATADHAAKALSAAFGPIIPSLPDATRALLYALQTVVLPASSPLGV